MLLNVLPDPLLIYDAEARVTYVNRAFEATFGWKLAELIGKPISFTPKSARDKSDLELQRSIEAEHTVVYETQRITKDGRLLDILLSGSRIGNADGSAAGMIVILHDISERVQMQDQMLAAQSSLISELSTPLMPISEAVLVMPLVGSIDTARAQHVMETLMEGVALQRARSVIIDITGVPIVDTQVAYAILRAAQAVKLLGAQVILTGIRPDVAQTVVSLGVDLSSIITRSSLQNGIAYALQNERHLI